MALAIHFDGLFQSGKVANYSELARLGECDAGKDDADHEFADVGSGDSGGDFVPAEDGRRAG
jgi:hypothetical protein